MAISRIFDQKLANFWFFYFVSICVPPLCGGQNNSMRGKGGDEERWSFRDKFTLLGRYFGIGARLRLPREYEDLSRRAGPAIGNRVKSCDNVSRPRFAALDVSFVFRVAARPGKQEGASL